MTYLDIQKSKLTPGHVSYTTAVEYYFYTFNFNWLNFYSNTRDYSCKNLGKSIKLEKKILFFKLCSSLGLKFKVDNNSSVT